MSVRINSEQAKALRLATPTVGRSKYRAKPTEWNGVRYASRLEAEYAAKLDAQIENGIVAWWIGQPTFRLGVPENLYRPDFMVGEFGDRPGEYLVHCVDCKGVETPKFRRDRVLWKRYGPVPLLIVRRDGIEIVMPDAEDTPR